jgi:glyoxylase-like metal-dependent hydrolase (beta-lactamase superfamily II)
MGKGETDNSEISRRSFIKGVGAGVSSVALGGAIASRRASANPVENVPAKIWKGGSEMKNVYKIYPILTCKLALDKGTFTYRTYYGERVMAPVYAWLIKGEGKLFLIDTGCSVKDAGRLSPAFIGEDGPDIEDSLLKKGISKSDIKTIILTHLHIDHFVNAKRFPNAKLIVQDEELKFARNPHPVFSKSYNRGWYEGLNLETVNGDREIFPGVEVIFTPGHTPGTQSVSIATEEGKKVICGFCSLDDNFSDKGDIVPGIHSDIFKAYDSMVRVRGLGGTIIPLHSERFLNVESIP